MARYKETYESLTPISSKLMEYRGDVSVQPVSASIT